MSWDELRTRTRQEIEKRVDAAVYRAGGQPGTNGRLRGGQTSGAFFFTADELSDRVRLLHCHLPAEAEAIVAQADEICLHRFRLLGYRDVDYGREIDWHLDAVHGKRTPLVPWFKIKFLDFEVAGDHKITWELNRHQHLVTLAKAWLLTGKDKYAKESIEQWNSWQRANPYPLGINWASSLEVAIRGLSWIWVHHLLAGCSTLPPNFRDNLVHGLAIHGRHIHRYLSTYFSANTHLLGEALALFFIGTLFPQIAAAEEWKQTGWSILLEEAPRQVLPDGVYFEQSLYYHVYALDFLLHARLLASRNGMGVPFHFDRIIRKMLAVVETLAQCGHLEGFGDDDGGRLFNPPRNRAEHMTDPLAIGASMFHDSGLCTRAALTEEAIWLLGENAVEHSSLTTESPHACRSQSFAEAGIYVMAGSDRASPEQLVIEAGPRSTGWCGHGHADVLNVTLSLGNRPWLVDSGTLAYIAPGGERNAFRGTRAHNTLVVDGIDQAEPGGPFAWETSPASRVELWISGPTFQFFAGAHTGYERLAQPVRHCRFVFRLDGGLVLVLDRAEGKGSHLLETFWHFAPDLSVSSDKAGYVAIPTRHDQTDRRLRVLPASHPSWKCELISGRVSPAYGIGIPAPLLRSTAQTALPAEHAMLLLPSVRGRDDADGSFSSENSQLDRIDAPEAAYRFDQSGFSHLMVFGCQSGKAWNHGPWSSDARFFYCCMSESRVRRLIFCHGSFVKLRSEAVILHDGNLEWLEWSDQRDGAGTSCSDRRALGAFSESTLYTTTVGN